MSEEEIRKILLCENIGELAYCGLLDKLDESNDNDLNELKKQAIQGLLDLYEKLINENNMYKDLTRQAQEDVKIWKDLYNKEKEKNNTIEAQRLRDMCYKTDGNYISKDKIREKIEKLNNEMLNENNSLELFYRKKYCKEVLQELLEESE